MIIQQYVTLESSMFPCVFYKFPLDVCWDSTGSVREQRELWALSLENPALNKFEQICSV